MGGNKERDKKSTQPYLIRLRRLQSTIKISFLFEIR